MRSGDLTGPMAESGFKGHPQCQFCRKRFYGDNELFVHMQSAHEQCFLCRRARPDRYVYYKDYNELEGAVCVLRAQGTCCLSSQVSLFHRSFSPAGRCITLQQYWKVHVPCSPVGECS